MFIAPRSPLLYQPIHGRHNISLLRSEVVEVIRFYKHFAATRLVEKCERCWNYSTHVGESFSYPKVCERSVGALREIEAGG
jgi:isoleucyl-tRNA synthetase